MANLSFSILQIIQENKKKGERYISPTVDTFKDIDTNFNILIDDTYYEVFIEKKDNYIWFELDFNKPNPRDEHLTNIKTGEKRENDREKEETELIHQFFCLYNFKNNLFYISNSRKQNVIKTILNQKTTYNFLFNTIKKTKEEFIELLDEVTEITFTEAGHLFNQDSKKRQALQDLTGTDSPTNFTINATYDKPKIIPFIKSLFREKENNLFKDLIIKGQDTNKFEVIFNNDTFSRKVEIIASKDENGKFIPDSVKKNLLEVVM
jgi:chaperonin cofactor prefoldin